MKRGLFALALALCVVLPACKPASAPPAFQATDITGAAFARDFRLTDHNGQVRTLADFRGKAVAVFFGYTHCPDVCPTTLADFAAALKMPLLFDCACCLNTHQGTNRIGQGRIS